MKYLFNLVKHREKLGWFEENWEEVVSFLHQHHLNGIEIMFHQTYDIKGVPEYITQGMHLMYWPTWIDFWKGNEEQLLSQFMSHENIEIYYGSLQGKFLVDHYQKEFKIAQDLNVDYMVFHVSHVQLEHIYRWDFTYTDEEIMDCAAELINETFGDKDKGVTLLFENLWWPGLNFKNPQLTEDFLNKIKYPNKGFMLDIGHLMITNPQLHHLEDACSYIMDVLRKHNTILDSIQGIHLNQSLTGKYLRMSHAEKAQGMKYKDLWDNLSDARKHISNIDTHIPFCSKGIKEIINRIEPKYIVYEFLPNSLEELGMMITQQNIILDR
ncbi:MAG: TIM barrel protein [Eubacteriales bacterium]